MKTHMVFCTLLASIVSSGRAQTVRLQSNIDRVQPMTGIVLWADNDKVESAPIQLEYAYMTYAKVVRDDGSFDWQPLEELLDQVASRKHQLVLRWHDTYVGKPTGIPVFVTRQPGYETTRGKSEGKATEFPDWSHPALQQFVFDFFHAFADRYDRDRRLAFVEVGFGLWAEYHIYDGPMKLGKTFPDKEYQTKFARHLSTTFRETPWMISVDAANEEWSAFGEESPLTKLDFGLFDDSFNHAKHARENEPNWKRLGMDRWKRSPTGGEFSFFKKVDQKLALAPKGPHGVSFEDQAARFHISFMIGDDQPRFQSTERIREAGMACGYRFRVEKLEIDGEQSMAKISNRGIAPIYYDAFPSVNGVRSRESLKGLLPGESKEFSIPAGGSEPKFSIECDRLVPGQTIGFEADLK